jgi:glucose 1-dehydrogenase
MAQRFAGRVCLITGAASGIGRATALRLAAEGGRIVVVDRDVEQGPEVADAIAASGGAARFVRADVADEDQIRTAVAVARDHDGGIDVLVNDAGTMTFAPVAELEPARWDEILAVDLRAPFLFCKHCIPHMRNGAIVNVSSIHAARTTAQVAPYAAAKAGLEALTRALAVELVETEIRVNAVAPGAIDTPLLWSNPNVASGAEDVGEQVGSPEDVAAAIAFLASDDAAFVNGATLVVDGGRLARL